MLLAHPLYIVLVLSAIGFVLFLSGIVLALKPAVRVTRHVGQIADDAIFLQIASVQMQFERLSHVGPETQPLAARARTAVAEIRSGIADFAVADMARGIRASNRAVREIISTFR